MRNCQGALVGEKLVLTSKDCCGPYMRGRQVNFNSQSSKLRANIDLVKEVDDFCVIRLYEEAFLKDMVPICMENTVNAELDFTGTEAFYYQEGSENKLTVKMMNQCEQIDDIESPTYCAANQNATSCSLPLGAPLVSLGPLAPLSLRHFFHPSFLQSLVFCMV